MNSSTNLLELLRRHSSNTDDSMGKILDQIRIAAARQEETRKELEKLWRTFGETVQFERKEKRVTLVELGGTMGVSKSALSYMESGERSWTIDLAEKAVKVLQ